MKRPALAITLISSLLIPFISPVHASPDAKTLRANPRYGNSADPRQATAPTMGKNKIYRDKAVEVAPSNAANRKNQAARRLYQSQTRAEFLKSNPVNETMSPRKH